MIKFALDESSLVQGAMGFFGGGIQRVLMKGLSGQYGKSYKENYRKALADQETQIKANQEFLKTKLNTYQTASSLVDEASQKQDFASADYNDGFRDGKAQGYSLGKADGYAS